MLIVRLYNVMAISMLLSFCHTLLHISVNIIVILYAFFEHSATVSCLRSCFVGGKTNPPSVNAGYGPAVGSCPRFTYTAYLRPALFA